MAEDLVLLRQSVWGAHASPRALSGVPPEYRVRRDAEPPRMQEG